MMFKTIIFSLMMMSVSWRTVHGETTVGAGADLAVGSAGTGTAAVSVDSDQVVDVILQALGNTLEGVDLLTSITTKGISETLKALLTNFGKELEQLKSAVGNAGVKSAIAEIVKSITSAITNIKQNLGSDVAEGLNSIKLALGAVVGDTGAAVKGVLSDVIDAKKEMAGKIIAGVEGTVSAVGGATKAIGSTLSEVHDMKMEVLKDVVSAGGTVAGEVASKAEGVAEGALSAGVDAARGVKHTVEGAVGGIKNLFKF